MQDILLEPRPQTSPDGKWFWNGREWRPITELPSSPTQPKPRASKWLPADKTDRRLVIVGYVFSVLPVIAFPGLLVQAGIGLGITNIIKGQTWHGIAMIVVALTSAVAGLLIGGKGAFG